MDESLEPPVAFVDDPVPARSRPWVDAEDLHVERVRTPPDVSLREEPGGLARTACPRTLVRAVSEPFDAHVDVVAGVMVAWAEGIPGARPFAALVCRVGQADETLTTAGTTHLVEHLVLPARVTPGIDFNGHVDAMTGFEWRRRRSAATRTTETASAGGPASSWRWASWSQREPPRASTSHGLPMLSPR